MAKQASAKTAAKSKATAKTGSAKTAKSTKRSATSAKTAKPKAGTESKPSPKSAAAKTAKSAKPTKSASPAVKKSVASTEPRPSSPKTAKQKELARKKPVRASSKKAIVEKVLPSAPGQPASRRVRLKLETSKLNWAPSKTRKTAGNAKRPTSGKRTVSLPNASAPNAVRIDKPLSQLRVACVTPTYNRHLFLPQARRYFLGQKFPHPENLHWFIYDDSPERMTDLDSHGGRIHYHYEAEKKPIGTKRNWLNRKAVEEGFDIICSMDDDDWYSPLYVAWMVDLLMKNDAPVAGSSRMHMFDLLSYKIYEFGPYRQNHSCNGVLCYKAEYAKHASYVEGAQKAEEGHFLKRWTTPVLQHPRPEKIFLGVIHPQNTVPKNKVAKKKLTTQMLLNYGLGQKDVAFYQKIRAMYLAKEQPREAAE